MCNNKSKGYDSTNSFHRRRLMLDQIRQAISLLRGVTSVTLKRQAKTGMDRAIDDIKNGRVYEASSVEDLIKQCKA